MSSRSIRRGLPVAFATVLLSLTAWSPGALAGGRGGKGLSKKDPRGVAIRGFWRCMRGQRCVESKVFRGATILREWRRSKHKLARIKILQTAMVAQVPSRYRAKFTRRWTKQVKKLAAAGFKKKALLRLGMGRSIITAKRRVALAFTSIKMAYRGRVATEYVILVLWKVKRRWYVAYVEDSPGKVRRFMINHKPK